MPAVNSSSVRKKGQKKGRDKGEEQEMEEGRKGWEETSAGLYGFIRHRDYWLVRARGIREQITRVFIATREKQRGKNAEYLRNRRRDRNDRPQGNSTLKTTSERKNTIFSLEVLFPRKSGPKTRRITTRLIANSPDRYSNSRISETKP